MSAHRSIRLPSDAPLQQLQKQASGCTRCDLYRNATQTVFGAGHVAAKIMLVGEQPGDIEDQQGKPFVGPAGRLLDECLEEAGIDRDQVYVTNAVKHFKWEPRGKLRIHKKPNSREITACKPWLEAEIDIVHPELIVCLGATAAQAFLGRSFRVTKSRGVKLELAGLPPLVATVHPSSILRKTEKTERDAERKAFVSDLRRAKGILQER